MHWLVPMAAEVGSLLRILNARKEEKLRNEATVLITRDLLGSCSKAASADLDLDLQVPTGWEKRLDLKVYFPDYFSQICFSLLFLFRQFEFVLWWMELFVCLQSGKVYVQRCKSPSPKSWSEEPALRDLNVPPLNLLEDSCLELKLLPSSHYQSVCTLDKVKSALERAEKEASKKRSSPPMSLSSSLTSRGEGDDEEEKRSWSLSSTSTSPASSSGMFAAGCPVCLLYVMTYRKNPKCPRCDSIVPSPSAFKKPRIDLNASFWCFTSTCNFFPIFLDGRHTAILCNFFLPFLSFHKIRFFLY